MLSPDKVLGLGEMFRLIDFYLLKGQSLSQMMSLLCNLDIELFNFGMRDYTSDGFRIFKAGWSDYYVRFLNVCDGNYELFLDDFYVFFDDCFNLVSTEEVF